jgi:tetrahydromethanopterin S-methyltransferase subunit G
MALTTEQIQTQKALMQQEIESLIEELAKKEKNYEDAFGKMKFGKKRTAGRFKTILISLVIGMGLLLGIVIAIRKFFPDLS